jgi:CRP/FNR family transcriptional regulator
VYQGEPQSIRSHCGLADFCACAEGTPEQLKWRKLSCTAKRLKRGEYLYNAGDPLQCLYPIRTGSFKTCAVTDQGREQVMGFYLRGEVLGLDSIGRPQHASTAVAIEDSEVCVVPFAHLEGLCLQNLALQRQFQKSMAREMAMAQNMVLVLGTMVAEERVAYFVLNLAARYEALGYSLSGTELRMSREEIGNFLGLKLETISRALSSLQHKGLIEVERKRIRILDIDNLRRMIGN